MTNLRTIVNTVPRLSTKTDTAHNVLREAILSGILAPGESITPGVVAEELGMSAIPVREALRRLEQDGLVTIKPHIGVTVRALELTDIEETMLIRAELEVLATRLAVNHLDETSFEELERILSQLDTCILDQNPKGFGMLNRTFHLTIYRAAPYARLNHFIESLWDQVPRARSLFALSSGFMEQSQRAHRKLLAALRSRHVEIAESIMREQKSAALLALKGLSGQSASDPAEKRPITSAPYREVHN